MASADCTARTGTHHREATVCKFQNEWDAANLGILWIGCSKIPSKPQEVNGSPQKQNPCPGPIRSIMRTKELCLRDAVKTAIDRSHWFSSVEIQRVNRWINGGINRSPAHAQRITNDVTFSSLGARCMTAIACLFVLSCVAKPPLGMQVINEERFTLVIQETWQMDADANNGQCKLLHDAAGQNRPFALRLCLIARDPDSIASEHGFFFDSGSWTYAGSMDIQPAELSVTDIDVRLTGVASCGITKETGFHAAGGECLTSIIFGEDYSIVFETDGTQTEFSEIDRIIESTVLTDAGSVDAIMSQIGPTSIAH